MKDEKNKVNCYQCKHFAVTWEPKFPNSCRLLGFKSQSAPSAAVYQATGKICEAFEKKGAAGKNEGLSGKDKPSVIVTIGDRNRQR